MKDNLSFDLSSKPRQSKYSVNLCNLSVMKIAHIMQTVMDSGVSGSKGGLHYPLNQSLSTGYLNRFWLFLFSGQLFI